MSQSEPSDNRNINTLLAVMAQLRNPQGGCPWDLEQNFKTIAPYTIEEAYEVADAITRDDMASLKEELGDLVFQAVFHAQMAEERGLFDFGDVVEAITDKMVRRHPHIFAEADLRSADEQTDAWERQKAEERNAKGYNSLLDDVPVGHAGLTRAVKLQKRAARVGFDWTDAGDVLNKIAEETRELAEAIDSADPDAIEDEFGDLLFVLANLSRHLKVDPEAALRRSNAKFIRRFQFIEREVARSERNMDTVSLHEMEMLWNQAKASE